MTRTQAGALASLILACAPEAQAQTRDISGEIAVSSELTERGTFVGQRQPIAQGALTLYDASGWSVGGALGVPTGGLRNSRLVLRAALDRPLVGDWQGQASLQYYGYPHNPGSRTFDRMEAAGVASWRDRLVLGATWFHYLHPASDTPALRWAVDLGSRWPLSPHWSAQAAVGLARISERSTYRYTSLGLAWHAGDWRAELSLLDADRRARRMLGDAATSGLVSASLTRIF